MTDNRINRPPLVICRLWEKDICERPQLPRRPPRWRQGAGDVSA